MSEDWKIPVSLPLFTDAYAQELIDKAKTEPRKAKAFDTRFRFSDAGRCSRQLGYEDLGVEPEVWDVASLHVAAFGTHYHELLQDALQRRYPNVKVEVKSVIVDLDSGHADALVEIDGVLWLYELKTKSTFQFDAAVGVNRKAFARKKEGAGGPGLDVIIQGGLNAMANHCDMLAVGYVCFENYSVGLAEKIGLRQMDRFLAEWHIPREVWEPLAHAEVERLKEIAETVDLGYLPEREMFDEDHWGELIVLNPSLSRPHWRCQYCSFRGRCEDDGGGTIPIPVDIRPEDIA